MKQLGFAGVFLFLISLAFSVNAGNGETVSVNGKAVYYEISNTGQDSPCEVYVHGNSADSSWMSSTRSKRSVQGKCVLSLDLPGHGKSEKHPAYPVPLMMNAIKAVINHSGVNKHPQGYYIVGWSYGGDLGIHLLDQLSNLKGIAVAGTPLISLTNRGLPSPARANSFAADTVIKGQYHLVGPLTNPQKAQLAQAFYCSYNAECIVPGNLSYTVLGVDNNVRSSIVSSFQASHVQDEITLLQNRASNIKLCIFYGTNDALVNPEYMIAVAKLVNTNYVEGIPTSHAMFLDANSMNSALNRCFQ